MAILPSSTDEQLVAPPPQEADCSLSSIVYDISQQVQVAMEDMLKMISEVDQNSVGIVEDIAKCKDSALERKRFLEEEKEKFQKAAYTVLDLLNRS